MNPSITALGIGALVVFLSGESCCAAPVAKPAASQHVGHDHSHHDHDHGQADPEKNDDGSAVFTRWPLLGLYSLVIICASLLGGWLPGHVQLSHLQFQLVMSVIGGLILGIGTLHLLPHAAHEIGGSAGIDVVVKWMLGGMLMMFFLLRAFHVHHHEPSELEAVATETSAEPTASADHTHGAHCNHSHAPQSRMSWMGIFFGLAVHTLLDGLALGATMQAEAAHDSTSFVGLGILLAIALHKPLDSLSITTLMIGAGKSVRTRWLVNLVYATLCPIGAATFLLGLGRLDEGGQFIVGCSLAFSAGVFLCIALADLLPEMEFHSHNRIRLSVALMLGIGLAWAIQFLEPAHLHQH